MPDSSAETASPKQPRPRPQRGVKTGLFELVSGNHDEAKAVDVVAVHGLQGDLWETWTHENGILWLDDILPDKLPFARITIFGYDHNIAFSGPVAEIEDKVIGLLDMLSITRSSVKKDSMRPIVFVCHCLGGILVKKALIFCHEHSWDARCQDILNNTKAIAFVGVPHRGADAAWWSNFAANSIKDVSLGMSTDAALFKDLQESSRTLATISEQFLDRGKDLKIYTFYETQELSGIVVADKESACLNLPNEKLFPVDANHRNICKIPSDESEEFEAVGARIEDLVRYVGTTRNLHSYFEIPNRRVFPFLGREDVISKIDRALSEGEGPYIAVVQSIGGQGKSQVAMEYCHRKKIDFLWIDGTSEKSVARSLASIYGHISTEADQPLDDWAKIDFVSKKFTNWPTRLLLVFDNYDNPGGFPNIRDFFPQNKLSLILVTGRNAEISRLVLGHSANFIELPGLEENTAVELLEHHSQVKETSGGFSKEIVKRLRYHPLAITQAGAYIRKGGIRMSEFIDIYDQEKEKVQKDIPQLSQYQRKLGDAEEEISLNVFTTWQLSFQQLLSNRSEDSVVVKLLRLLAFFDNRDISEWIFIEFHRSHITKKTSELLKWMDVFIDSQNRWNGLLFKENLDILKDFCLIESVSQDSGQYSHASLHPLVTDWIRLQMGKSARQQYALMATKILGDILDRFSTTIQFRLPLPTKSYLLLQLIAQERNNSECFGGDFTEQRQDIIIEFTVSQLCFVTFFFELGLYGKAESLVLQVIDIKKKVLGPEHPSVLANMNNLALMYRNQGRLEEAERLQIQVAEAVKRVLGPEHRNTLAATSNLACTWKLRGRNSEALEAMEQCVQSCIRSLGDNHPDTLSASATLREWKEEKGVTNP